MSVGTKIAKIGELIRYSSSAPNVVYSFLSRLNLAIKGFLFGYTYREGASRYDAVYDSQENGLLNPLERFFNERTVGRGIWKWTHYFDYYHSHFKCFVGKPVNILEIGVFSGGSLEMWRSYFGDKCKVYGVDIAPACTVFENDYTKIFIGDQSDRRFWESFRAEALPIDIVVDDGGHEVIQQIVTLEELLPHITPGGVYICEDIHGVNNGFNSYCQGLTMNLNHYDGLPGEGIQRSNQIQAWVKGIHFYPYMTVIEKTERPIDKLTSVKHGTLWAPIRCE
jgi:hypothetical protein